MKQACLLILLTLLTSCATSAKFSAASCAADQQFVVQDFVYFGTAKPDGRVAADEWARFLENTVTQAFPDGFTAWEATGQWRSASGDVIREPSYVVSFVHPDTVEADAAVRTVIETYKLEFQQEAVLRVSSAACMSL